MKLILFFRSLFPARVKRKLYRLSNNLVFLLVFDICPFHAHFALTDRDTLYFSGQVMHGTYFSFLLDGHGSVDLDIAVAPDFV